MEHQDIATQRTRLADPDDIWAGYDVDAVQQALRDSAGALIGVNRDELLADIRAARAQARARPA